LTDLSTRAFTTCRSPDLATAAKHGRRPFDVLTELTSGNVWIPATTGTVSRLLAQDQATNDLLSKIMKAWGQYTAFYRPTVGTLRHQARMRLRKSRRMAMPTPREVIVQIVAKARDDKDFFHALVFDPESALAAMEGLDEATKNRLRAISPTTFFIPELTQSLSPELKPCDPTCTESCVGTCGPLSCDVTCGPENKSCAATCGASCGKTLEAFPRS